MPTSMTFDSLTADMQTYLERGTSLDVQVANQIPRLINLAERAIATAFKIQGFQMPVNAILVKGKSVYRKPNGWRQTVSMNYGVSEPTVQNLVTEGGTTIRTEGGDPIQVRVTSPVQNRRRSLYARSYEYCRHYWPDSSIMDDTLELQPKFYADYDYNHWLIVPTPAIGYPWEINYYGQPPLLDDGNQTNWLTDFAPNLLLYRALLEATPYLKNDERIPVWQQLYQEQLQGINKQDVEKLVDRQTLRDKA